MIFVCSLKNQKKIQTGFINKIRKIIIRIISCSGSCFFFSLTLYKRFIGYITVTCYCYHYHEIFYYVTLKVLSVLKCSFNNMTRTTKGKLLNIISHIRNINYNNCFISKRGFCKGSSVKKIS